MNRLIVLLALAASAASVAAAPAAITLAVPGMDCPVCPITVKQALTRVPGVSKVTVNFDKRHAVVEFDDAKTRVDALTQATRDAGYPSSVALNAR